MQNAETVLGVLITGEPRALKGACVGSGGKGPAHAGTSPASYLTPLEPDAVSTYAVSSDHGRQKVPRRSIVRTAAVTCLGSGDRWRATFRSVRAHVR
jgi:hypothetical protein